MNLNVTLRRWGGAEGSLEWDSSTGLLEGPFAERIRQRIAEAVKCGLAGWGPLFCFEHPVSDPLHKPEELALILRLMGFILPPPLAAVYPEPPAALLDNPYLDGLTPEELALVDF